MGRNKSNKTRTSITIDPDVKEELDQMDHVTLSGLVNETAREFVAAGRERRDGLEIRKERLEAEIKELEHELEEKRETLVDIEETLEERENDTDEQFNEAVRQVAQTIESRLERHGEIPSVDNPAVTQQAKKANVAPKELLEAAKEQANV